MRTSERTRILRAAPVSFRRWLGGFVVMLWTSFRRLTLVPRSGRCRY